MENQYLAKSNGKKTIKEHTDDLLRQYNILKNMYPHLLDEKEWEILSLAIKYHDLGKINSKFQNKLYKAIKEDEELLEEYEGQEVPHNFLSPFFINGKIYKEKYGKENAKALISAVYYHHDRVKVEYDSEIIEKELTKQIENFGDFYGLDLSKPKERFHRYLLQKEDEEIKLKKYILIKGLLNKIDYVASLDKNMVNVEEDVRENGETVSDKIDKLVQDKFNGKYREVQEYMKSRKDENIIVVAPCGSGKTEAALLWIGDSKAFYTLPLKVSINAIYNRIKNTIGYKKALLLHSDAFSYYLEEADNEINSYDRAKRLSSPLIITTIDQLFRIIFRYNGYEEILATLSYSKLVIDEIQMYSSELLSYILIGLKMISQLGGKFAIMTATFPPLLYDFLDKLELNYTKQECIIKPNIEKRHKIEVIEEKDFDIEKIMENGRNKKVLIIVNTIKKAQELYDKLSEENVHLLHSHYLKKDRDMLEKNILEFTDRNKNNQNGIWISTQIVEASLDIDFDVLFTDMTSVDSLFQRMGRVYRSREYTENEPNVYIYNSRNGVPKIINSEIYEYSFKAIKEYTGRSLSEEDKQKIINKVFDLNENKELINSKYYHQIKENIRIFSEIKPYETSKNEASKVFRNITSIQVIPDNIFEELNNKGIIEKWVAIFKSSTSNIEKVKTKNEINKYTISIAWNPNLEFDKEELFYPHSNIHRTCCKYEFNTETLKGKGLIINKKEIENFF